MAKICIVECVRFFFNFDAQAFVEATNLGCVKNHLREGPRDLNSMGLILRRKIRKFCFTLVAGKKSK